MGKQIKGKVSVKVTTKKSSEPIKPKMGKGTGGMLTARLLAHVKKDKK